MKYIFLIAAFNALFFSLLIIQKKKALHDVILICWLVYLGIYTGIYALFSNILFTSYHLLSAGFISLLMLHGPFLYLYISSLIFDRFKISAKHLLHLIPFILFNIFLLISTFFPEFAERIRLDHIDISHGTPLLFNLFLILTALSGPIYYSQSIRLFRQFDLSIFNNFSTTENANLDWLKKLIYSFGVIWTVLMAIAIIHHVFQMFSWIFCTDGLFLSLSVFIILVGYFGLKQREIFIHYPEQYTEYVTEPKIKYAGVVMDDNVANQYLRTIEHFFDKEKPYLEPDLSLPVLASRLQIPSHHLSRVINEKLGLNFFDFINKYRVEEVKIKMADPAYDYLSLLGIAFECGFNTKSAFNRVFKKITGMTPSEYKKRL
jgi:AraC-like DNA-binding protein